ncbi:MAG: hypothetical protein A2Y24_00085 [Clostridiales bacterium GWE2_32_10]|nr:MAG: hypothetical protein A2Y24_00085 [Clostridiales bacterium GWE2_32_10]HBY19606.1 ABC transporter permease [Clostridiales bacterium]
MNVYLVETKRLIKSFLIWSIVIIILLSLFMSFFPSMATSDMAELVKAKINAIPPAMRNAFGINQMLDFSDLLQYLAYVLQFIFIAACIYAAILGASALIKEESEGTIEFLYAKPISRVNIVTMKLLSNLTILLLFNLMIYIVCIIFCEIFKEPGYQYIIILTIMFKSMFATQMVFLGIGFLVSTILRRYSYAMPIALGIFFTTYILGIFSGVIDKIKWLEYLSPYHYTVPLTVLKQNGNIEPLKITLMLAIIASSIFFTYIRYYKKDLLI